MKRLDNKGQSLILFILLIPIMLGVMALVIDCGNVMVKKNEINNVIEMVLDYGFVNVENTDSKSDIDKIDDVNTNNMDSKQDNDISDVNEIDIESLKALLEYNLKSSHNEVSIDDGKILIKSDTYVEGIFSRIFGFRGFKIESEYVGYRDNARVIKEKIK